MSPSACRPAAFVSAFLLVLGSLAWGQDTLRLVTLPASPVVSPPITDKTVVYQRPVVVGGLDALEAAQAVRLDLLPGLSVRATRTGTRSGASWIGVVDEVADSSVVLTVDNGILTGRVLGPFGTFRVAWLNGTYVVQEVTATASGDGWSSNANLIVPFLENTDAFWTAQKGNTRETAFPYVLEADIFPHLAFHQDFTSVIDLAKQQRRDIDHLKEISWAISGTPAVRLRMRREESAPVRTPSYMPRGNFQLMRVFGLKSCRTGSVNPSCQMDPARNPRLRLSPADSVQRALSALTKISILEGHFMIGHHSNGQDGCLSTTQRREQPSDKSCVPEAVATRATINRTDGSFSTSYLRFGFTYTHHTLDDEAVMQAREERRVSFDIEHHLPPWVDSEIRDLYGRIRLTLAGSYAVSGIPFCRKRLEGAASGTWNPNVVSPVANGFVFVQGSCFPATNGGWGFFGRYYFGQDYYNVGFLDDLARLQFGLTFNQFGFLRFRRSTTPSGS